MPEDFSNVWSSDMRVVHALSNSLVGALRVSAGAPGNRAETLADIDGALQDLRAAIAAEGGLPAGTSFFDMYTDCLHLVVGCNDMPARFSLPRLPPVTLTDLLDPRLDAAGLVAVLQSSPGAPRVTEAVVPRLRTLRFLPYPYRAQPDGSFAPDIPEAERPIALARAYLMLGLSGAVHAARKPAAESYADIDDMLERFRAEAPAATLHENEVAGWYAEVREASDDPLALEPQPMPPERLPCTLAELLDPGIDAAMLVARLRDHRGCAAR